MRKKTIKSIYFHFIKLTLILVPIIFLICSFFVPNDNVVSVTPVYKYQTNSVSSSSDLVVGNIYHFSFDVNYSSSESDFLPVSEVWIPFDKIFNEEFGKISRLNNLPGFTIHTPDNTFGIYYNSNNNRFTIDYVIYYDLDPSLVQTVNPQFFECDFVLSENPFPADVDISYCISASDFNVIESFETGTVREDLNNFFTSFRNYPINSWYFDFIDLLGFSVNYSSIFGVILSMPLWILWVNIIELLLDCILFIPRLAHKWLGGLTGGDKDD